MLHAQTSKHFDTFFFYLSVSSILDVTHFFPLWTENQACIYIFWQRPRLCVISLHMKQSKKKKLIRNNQSVNIYFVTIRFIASGLLKIHIPRCIDRYMMGRNRNQTTERSKNNNNDNNSSNSSQQGMRSTWEQCMYEFYNNEKKNTKR